MADTPVEVKKAPPARTAATPDVWGAMRNEMERFFDRGFGWPSLRRMFEMEPPWRTDSSFTFNAPAVDISENAKAFKITAELPGLEQKDIEVTVSGDTLILKGEKQQEEEKKEDNYYMSERAYGSFQRAFALPQGVDRDKINADLKKGVLTITLPKTPQAQQQHKKIDVKGG